MTRPRKKFLIELQGRAVDRLNAVSHARGMVPEYLLARLCNLILIDNLIEAVLDDGEAGDKAAS